MSRVGNSPINIPSKVEVSLSDESVVVKGPKGSMDLMIPECLNLEQNDSILRVTTKDQSKKNKSIIGYNSSASGQLR